jgi:hypothetical protein
MTNKKSKKKKVTLTKQDEITDAAIHRMKRLEDIHSQRLQERKSSDILAFWTFLFIALITNFFLSFILIFLIVFLQHPLLYVIVVVIGLAFGWLYTYLIHSLRNIMIHHHIYANVFMIVTAVINIIYIVVTSTIVLQFFEIPNVAYNQIGVGLAYFVSYIIPYVIERIAGKSF